VRKIFYRPPAPGKSPENTAIAVIERYKAVTAGMAMQ
jgi:hypothetical protein